MNLRIMTSNIWGDYFGNEVEGRDEQLFGIYEKYSPDILGLQEMTNNWYRSPILEKLSKTYSFVGMDLFCMLNYTPMMYKTEKFELIEKGFKYLPETPDKSKSISWSVLKDKESEKLVAACNTHFMWRTGEEWDKIRENNAKCLTALMKELAAKYSCPVFAFGDMNCYVSSLAFKVYEKENVAQLIEKAKDADRITSWHGDPVRGEDGKYHGTTIEKDYTASIDHIVGIGKYDVEKYAIVTDQTALDATDHSPVYADIVM